MSRELFQKGEENVTDSSFISPPNEVSFELEHTPSGFVGETLDIVLKVMNNDERPLDLTLSAFLQPGEEDDRSSIEADGRESKSMLENIEFGALSPGSSASRVVRLRSPVSGTKNLDFSLFSTAGSGRAEETVRRAVIPILDPFECVSAVAYDHAGSGEGEATIKTLIKRNGPGDIVVDSLTLNTEVCGSVPQGHCLIAG